VAGAVIGGLIAGPVGVAAGGLAGRAVNRGPRKKSATSPKPAATKKVKAVSRKPAKKTSRKKVPPIYPLPL
jgi:hypothetical protein